VSRRRLFLQALLLLGALAACGKRGVLELPPAEEAPVGQPPAEPSEDEDEG
jgi:predicted small lipoprotein YifL